MKEIKVKLCEITTRVLFIGFEGEQNHTQVAFDCSPIFADYPDAVASLAVKPPVGNVYPKVVTRDGNEVLWVVSASDCANEGNGEYQLTFTNGNEIIKTWIGNMRLYNSLLANGNPPTPIQDWIEDANAVLGSLENISASATGLPAGSDPTAEITDVGGHKNISIGIPAGEQGEQGEPGFSPVITVTEITGGHRITVNDAEGTQTVDVLDGEKGDTGNGIASAVLNQDYTLTLTFTDGTHYTTTSIRGAQGAQGNPGADGYSPTAIVSKSGSVVTITITDKDGTTTSTVEDGATGATGATPVISIGTVTTLSPGSDATASMDVTDPEHPVLSFGIPEGEPGEVTEAELSAVADSKADVITDTASGAIASFPDGANGMPVKSLVVNVDPVQDLHGYENPWPAGGGKNLVPLFVSETINGVTLTNNNGEITLNGTASADATFDVVTDFLIPSGSTYYLCCFNPVASESSRLSLFAITENGIGNPQKNMNVVNGSSSSTVSSDTHIIKFRIRAPEGIQLNNFKLSPMFQIGGTQPTVWTSYSNICPISGWDSANVSRTGKNLLNKSDGKSNNANWWIGSNAVNGEPDGTFVLNAGTYTLSTSETSDGIYVRKNGSNVITVYNNTKATFTLTEKTPIKLMLYKTGVAVDYWNTIGIQLELGSIASSYEPYSGSATEYAFPEAAKPVYGGTLTIHKDGTGELVVDKAYLNAKNAEWADAGSGRVYTSLPLSPTELTTILCSHCEYHRRPATGAYTDWVDWGGYPNSNRNLIVTMAGITDTLNAWNAYIQSNDVEFVYYLETPVTYQLTNQQVIETLKGINNVWADTGNVSAEYPCDTKLYIDKKLTASRNLMELIITANHEDIMKATKAYTTGNLLIVNGTLYKATTSIANGATLTVGTNVTATTVANELALLA